MEVKFNSLCQLNEKMSERAWGGGAYILAVARLKDDIEYDR